MYRREYFFSLHCPNHRLEYLKNAFSKHAAGQNEIEDKYKNDIEFGSLLQFLAPRAEISKGKVLLFEPHPDDVAYSIGGSLAKMYLEGYWLKDICVFTKGGKHESIRHQESRMVWNTILQSEIELLDFLDAPFRGIKNVFQASINEELDTLHHLIKSIDEVIKRDKPEIIIGPLSIGFHIDHMLLNEALINIYNSNNSFELWFYEDFPYLNKGRYEYIKTLSEVSSKVPVEPFYVNITDFLPDKVSLHMVYKSQINIIRSIVSRELNNLGKAICLEGLYKGRDLDSDCIYERLWRCKKV